MKEDDFDVLIVGSDQIWRPIYIANIEDAYLGFAKDWYVRRIAYATSFGVDDWSEYSDEQTQVCRELIKKFDAFQCVKIRGWSFVVIIWVWMQCLC